MKEVFKIENSYLRKKQKNMNQAFSSQIPIILYKKDNKD